jgi:two-component system, OmpR family, sensor kinase
MTAENPARSGELSREDLALFAHELRGALTVIAGYTALMRHELSPAERQGALEGIERAIARADMLCADALAGRPPLAASSRLAEKVAVAPLAEHVVADQRSATGRDIVLSIAPGVTGAEVLGDEQALERVLGNLIGNAAKYSPPSDPVEVSLAPGVADNVAIEVADRGLGIPEADRERVFEPFARLDRDAEKPGTGLGLAIVADVVERHRGSIDVLDREGGGTVVRIELPVVAG